MTLIFICSNTGTIVINEEIEEIYFYCCRQLVLHLLSVSLDLGSHLSKHELIPLQAAVHTLKSSLARPWQLLQRGC
jgi:hypothetical protein